MADAFGVPEFFVTHVGEIEDAGGGNVRVFRCIKRCGVLIPVFSLVTPTFSMIPQAKEIMDAARNLVVQEAMERRHH